MSNKVKKPLWICFLTDPQAECVYLRFDDTRKWYYLSLQSYEDWCKLPITDELSTFDHIRGRAYDEPEAAGFPDSRPPWLKYCNRVYAYDEAACIRWRKAFNQAKHWGHSDEWAINHAAKHVLRPLIKADRDLVSNRQTSGLTKVAAINRLDIARRYFPELCTKHG